MRVDDLEYYGMDIESPGWAMYEDVHVDTVFPDGTVVPVMDTWADKSGYLSDYFDKYNVRDSVPGVYTLRMTGEFSGLHTAQYTLLEVPYEDLVMIDTATTITGAPTLTVTAAPVVVGHTGVVKVVAQTLSGVVPTGTVTLASGAKALGQATLSNGRATVSVGKLAVGSHRLTVRYSGSDTVDAAPKSVVLVVMKAASTLKATAKPVVVGHAGRVAITLKTAGPRPARSW